MSDGAFDPGGRPRSSRGHAAASAGSLSVYRLREIEALLGAAIGPAYDAAPARVGAEPDFARQTIRLLRAFNRIADPETRRAVLRLVEAASRRECI
ncbi:hypothetical protein DK419_05375 [Methylobacterium terrae]|uniref:Uncharacterized protein n=1 Tax=Methylobacterium terrae TaxID=2202827 RepID=A0A2U8WI33_9HYPH|nr:hypothetical protein [Methylobacterium terrae]AWN45817.1 hypothetical protein DK419_05375 [Methylobacterium terrae]